MWRKPTRCASNPDLALYDLQILDSMKTVELLVALSRDVGVEISPADFEREAWATPRKLVEDVLKRTGVEIFPRRRVGGTKRAAPYAPPLVSLFR